MAGVSKVIITAEQAKAMYFLTGYVPTDKDYNSLIEKKCEGYTHPNTLSLNSLSHADFVRALDIGFEIEQAKFEVGDVVKSIAFGNIFKITDVDSKDPVGEATYLFSDNKEAIGRVTQLSLESKFFVHATKEEAFWAELGRGYREFLTGDVIILEGQLGFKIHDERQISAALAQWEKGKVTGFYNVESLKSFPIGES